MTFANTHAPSGHRRCRHLRCNQMYYNVRPQEGDRSRLVTDDLDDPHVYWCLKTHKEFGPEGKDVGLEACRPDRTCYQA